MIFEISVKEILFYMLDILISLNFNIILQKFIFKFLIYLNIFF
jgi:hypothetical protein